MEAKQAKDRIVDPYHIANLAGEWYVFAWCHKENMVIQFAVPRIQTAKLLNRSFSIPHDFDPEKLLSSTFGRFASGENIQEVRLLFDKEIAPWVLERQ